MGDQHFLLINTFNKKRDIYIFKPIKRKKGNILALSVAAALSQGLSTTIQAQEETESRPRYLDKNVLALPYIALDTLSLELSRIATMCVELLQKNLRQQNYDFKSRSANIRNLAGEVGKFSAELNKNELIPFISEALMSLMHSLQEYIITIEISEDIARLGKISMEHQESDFSSAFHEFFATADRHLDSLTPDNTPETIKSSVTYDEVEKKYDTLKEAILLNALFGNLDISQMDILLQYANQVKRGCRHTWKAARRLNSVRESLQRNAEGEVIESKVSDQTNIELLQDAQQTLADNEEIPVTESES